MVAAGRREEGSQDDFYAALTGEAQAARARYNAQHSAPVAARTYVGQLLPGSDDRDRYRIEAAVRERRKVIETLRELTRGSLRDGHEHVAELPAYRLGITVRADDGHETYVAVRITGAVRQDLTAVILRNMPGRL